MSCVHPLTRPYNPNQDNVLKQRWSTNKIPMHLLVEEFLKDNLEFKLDILETLENHREEFIDWRRRPQSKSGGRRAEGGGRRAEGGGRRA